MGETGTSWGPEARPTGVAETAISRTVIAVDLMTVLLHPASHHTCTVDTQKEKELPYPRGAWEPNGVGTH